MRYLLGVKRLSEPGKTGEVGPPASGRSFFTSPYSRFALNGGSCSARRRLPPTETREANAKARRSKAKARRSKTSHAKEQYTYQGVLPAIGKDADCRQG